MRVTAHRSLRLFGMLENSNANCLRGLAKPAVQRSQGKAAAKSDFQIRRVVDTEFKTARKFKKPCFIVLVVHRDAQGQTILQRVRHLLRRDPAPALVYQQGVAQLVPPNTRRDPAFFDDALHGAGRRRLIFIRHAPGEKYGVVDNDLSQ